MDLTRSVYELTEAYPELIPILKDCGFLGVANPVVRTMLGKVTTLPQACARQGRDLEQVIAALKEQGFAVE
ncbi:MAG: DUF1858 domain-containing protein [Lentisphaerae bacterium]|nr:DUF1858 domain-containing protein [Lentisphaerota bacterium]